MWNLGNLRGRAILLHIIALAGILLSVGLVVGCNSSKPAESGTQSAQSGPKRYPLHGRVVSIEKDKRQVVVDHGEITGFMMAMTMGYSVKNASLLDSLSPEDQITADVVVNGDDVWLENIVVVKKADQAKANSSPEPKKK
jgi:Cu/Ag efflux protein CusF